MCTVSAFGRSAQVVLALFAQSDSPLTQEAIRRRTSLAKRTVKYSLKRLKALGIVSERAALGDMRRRIYFVKGGVENGYEA